MTTGKHAIRVHALHLLTRVALRLWSPLRAKAVVDRAADLLPPLRCAEEARLAMAHLLASGTCLSRALAIGAQCPQAEVVIGVDPWSSASLTAHAWLEIEGARIETAHGQGGAQEELARFPAKQARSEAARTVR